MFRSVVARLVLALLLGSCGWWRTPEMAQRDWAQKMTPKLAAPAPAQAAAKYTLRIRALVDSRYMSQNPHWEQRVRSLVERASRLAEGRFGARFELVSVGAWDHPDADVLPPLLEHLRAEHPAGDADLVIGFTSSLQIFTSSFEDVGLAYMFGQHAVLRGIDQHEQSDIILNELRALSMEERTAVVRARVEHQEAVVFLHEWGHCAGAIHDRNPAFIMAPSYSDEQKDFSAAGTKSIELMLKYLRGDREAWRAEAGKHLTSLPPTVLARGAQERIAEMFGAADGGTPPPAVEERPLSDADRQLFNIAVGKSREGRDADALATMLPLVKRYPTNGFVQTFACNLALRVKDGTAAERCKAALEVAKNDPRPAISLAWARADAEDSAGAREAVLEARKRAAAAPKREPHQQAELAQALLRVGYVTYAEQEARLAEMTLPAQEMLEAAARMRGSYGLTPDVMPPDDEPAYVEACQLARTALSSRKSAEAPQRGAALTKQYPKVPGAWLLACEAQLALGFSAEARGACGKALQLDSTLARAHYLLAITDANERKAGAAIEHLKKSIALDDSNQDAWWRLAMLYAQTHMDAARIDLQQRYQAKFGKPLK